MNPLFRVRICAAAVTAVAAAGTVAVADCITCTAPACGATVKVCQNGASVTVTVNCPGKQPVVYNFSTGVRISAGTHCNDTCYFEVSPTFPLYRGMSIRAPSSVT
jgi:hypothetical protein